MREQPISFEVAKLAKEKGFNIRSEPYRYNSNGELTLLEGINAPTQSLLQKWLRDVHNIDVCIQAVRFTGYLEIGYWTYYVCSISPTKNYRFETYEEAFEVGLQEGLKLVE